MVPYVLVAPGAAFLLGWFYVARLPRTAVSGIRWRELPPHWKMLLRVGLAFMGGAVATTLVQLWIRVDVANILGAPALGQFQASWTISQQYIAVVLGAMAADYYPRLTGTMREPAAAARLINEQTEIALLLSAPIFLAMMGLAPWVLRVLYTADFTPAVAVLRWQVLADVLKVASWPLGFVFLAAGDGKTYFWTEITALLVVALVIEAFLRPFGLDVAGIAYLASYAVYLPLVHQLAKRRIGFLWSRAAARLLTVTFVACAAVGAVAVETRWGVLVGCLAALAFAIYAVGRLSEMSDIGGPAGRIGAWARQLNPMRSK
jgi:PST family polysaccharide transporter